MIGAVLSSGLAKMADLETTLSLEDAYELLDVARVDAHNRRVASKRTED